MEYTMKHELQWLREQNVILKRENTTLKEAVEKGLGNKPPNAAKIGTGENEFSWTKKMNFYSRLTMKQCSSLYDNLDARGREVVLSAISQKNQTGGKG